MVPLIEGDRRFRPAEEGGDGRLGGACLPVAHLVLAFCPDGIGPTEDHDALLRFKETIPVLACRATPLGCRLLAVSLLWPTGLSEETFEELALLVEVFDGVGVIEAQTIHEFVEVAWRVLLGLSARVICRGGQCRVGWSAEILSVLLSPLCGGAFILILALGLAFVVAPIKARHKRHLLGVLDKGPWCQTIRARTPTDTARVLVRPKPRIDRRSAWGGR